MSLTLLDALEITRQPTPADGEPLSVTLACGFEPLHLGTLLTAELRLRLPATRVDVRTGLFDDLPGNVRRGADTDALAVLVEWADLDPRLGLRRLGGWPVDDVPAVVAAAGDRLAALEREIAHAARTTRVACLLPTLPLPPLFPDRPARSGATELALRAAVAETAARLAGRPGVSVGSLQRLAEISPVATRRDVQSELHSGCPYSVGHAAAVAAVLTDLIAPPTPRRGLITDLDDTMWQGLLDEVGPAGVSWIDSGHRHGLYQQLLASLADAGVLIGVASRNDPDLVAETLSRPDLLIDPERIFPVQITTGEKAASLRRILDVWHLHADAVVFVDDSPLELDAARHALPGLETAAFPDGDDGVWQLLVRLRTLFAKDTVTPEDRLRLTSLRSAAGAAQAPTAPSTEDFLAGIAGQITFSCPATRPDRALELINKCNQFHLNGRRLVTLEAGTGRRLVTVDYADRYGPLGLIAALVVNPHGDTLEVTSWAMSCRALARRIEHHTLAYLFDRFGVQTIQLAFHATERNLALQEFLAGIVDGEPHGRVWVNRRQFGARAPALVHQVAEAV